MTRLPLILALCATTAHATPWTDETGNCYSDHCQSTGIPDQPYQPPTSQPDHDRDPTPLTTPQHYGFCCTDRQGVTRYHTAWLRDDATAKAQCDAKPIEDLRTCPDSIQRRIDAADGVE